MNYGGTVVVVRDAAFWAARAQFHLELMREALCQGHLYRAEGCAEMARAAVVQAAHEAFAADRNLRVPPALKG